MLKMDFLEKLAPSAIVVRTNLYWEKHCKLVVRTYYELHDEPDPSNTMTPKTHVAIALGKMVTLNGT